MGTRRDMDDYRVRWNGYTGRNGDGMDTKSIIIGRINPSWRGTWDLAAVVMLGLLTVNWYMTRPVPVSEIYTVEQVYVTDYKVGVDPIVVYDRTVLKSFVGEWFASVYPMNSNFAVCAGQGKHHYNPIDEPINITLSWYLDERCDLPVGEYLMRTVWSIEGSGVVRNTSNVWEVTE